MVALLTDNFTDVNESYTNSPVKFFFLWKIYIKRHIDNDNWNR